MAKKKVVADERVGVVATASFRYEGRMVRIGDALDMRASDVDDYRALHMVRLVEPAP